jgi:hypothetical protein
MTPYDQTFCAFQFVPIHVSFFLTATISAPCSPMDGSTNLPSFSTLSVAKKPLFTLKRPEPRRIHIQQKNSPKHAANAEPFISSQNQNQTHPNLFHHLYEPNSQIAHPIFDFQVSTQHARESSPLGRHSLAHTPAFENARGEAEAEIDSDFMSSSLAGGQQAADSNPFSSSASYPVQNFPESLSKHYPYY